MGCREHVRLIGPIGQNVRVIHITLRGPSRSDQYLQVFYYVIGNLSVRTKEKYFFHFFLQSDNDRARVRNNMTHQDQRTVIFGY